jgi:hypothetical protein
MNFKSIRFTDKENVSGVVQAKSTVIKSIRNKLVEDYPYIEDYIDDILPKKDNVRIIKWYVFLMSWNFSIFSYLTFSTHLKAKIISNF